MNRMWNFLAAGKTTRRLIAVAALALAAAPGAAQAVPVTFAQYNVRSGVANDLSYVNHGDGTADLISNTDVTFQFLLPGIQSIPGFNGPINAHMTITAHTSTGVVDLGGTLVQAVDFGTLTIYSDNPLGPYGRTNLLTSTFGTTADSSPVLFGDTNTTSAALATSTDAGDSVTFQSDFLNFSAAQSRTISLSLTSLISSFLVPPLNGLQIGNPLDPNSPYNSFSATSSGTFSSDPPPIIEVPEPTTVTLLGLGLIGAPILFRRRLRQAAALNA